jgi:hypothetical protein
MSSIKRFVSGVVLGGGLLAVAAAFGPQSAFAQGGFCDESGGKTYCCSTDANGKIVSCVTVG